MRQRLAVTLLVLLVLSLTVSAEVRRDRNAGISYDIPSWWQSQNREEGVVMATEDETLVVMLWVPEGKTLRQAVNELDTELSKVIQNATPESEPTSGSLNGMETLSISGRGRINGARAEYSVIIIDAKKPVIVMAFGESGKYEKHTEELKGFLKTIKRLK